jgi:DNA-binding transcriptional MerR regulator
MKTSLQRSQPITQALFDRLPALLHPGQFAEFSGIHVDKLASYVEAGVIGVHEVPGPSGRRMFYKSDLARLAGFRCDLPGARPAETLGKLVQVLGELDAAGLATVLQQLAVLRAQLPEKTRNPRRGG